MNQDENIPLDKPLHIGAVKHEFDKAWLHKKCFHPQAATGVCNKIIDAHTVQRSTTLSSLIDEGNKVLTFYNSKPEEIGLPVYHTEGWREASTFTGFCSKHDDEVFAPLEKYPFIASPEQSFLLAYRTLCHELFQKEGATSVGDKLPEILMEGAPPELQTLIRREWYVIQAGTKRGLEACQHLKGIMDEQLTTQKFVGWSGVSIYFTGTLCLTTAGIITPNRDLDDNILQVLHDPTSDLQHLIATIIIHNDGGVISFLWKADQEAPRRFVDSLLAKGNQNLPSNVVQSAFIYIENTFFSSQWWRSLTDSERLHIQKLAGIPNAYYSDLDYSSSSFVPWEISDVKTFTV